MLETMMRVPFEAMPPTSEYYATCEPERPGDNAHEEFSDRR